MDAFESLISMLLRHEGYWTTPSFKVELSKSEKRRIDRASSPRWELDLVAYKGSTNEILAVECKSFLDSTGVVYRKNFEPERRYKLFADKKLRSVVFSRLVKQLEESGACRPKPQVRLCLAAGKIAKKSNSEELRRFFQRNEWLLFDASWILKRLVLASEKGYENDIAFIVSKLILKNRDALAELCEPLTNTFAITSKQTSRSPRDLA